MQNNTKENKKGVRAKPVEFRLYKIWKSLPPIGINDVSAREFMKQSYGTDSIFIELFDIRNQKEFSERYKVNMATLSQWNKELNTGKDPIKTAMQWAEPLVKNVLTAMYRASMSKDPKASRDRENFMKMIGKYNDKLGIVDESKMSWVQILANGMGIKLQDDEEDDDDTGE